MLLGKYRRLIENTGLMLIGSLGSKFISFIMLPFYTIWLSVEDYGRSDMISVYSTVLLAFISLSIGDAIFVIPSQKSKEKQTSYFTSSLVFSIGCIFALVCLYYIVQLVFYDIQSVLFNNILDICLITASTLYSTIFQQFCKSVNKIKTFASAGIVQTLTVACFGFLLIPTYKLDGYIWCILLGNLTTIIYIFFFARLYTYINISSFSIIDLKEMLRYSIPLIPNSVVWLIVSYLSRPIMEGTLGLYALGIYSLANRFPSLINTVFNTFSNSWQISILEQYGKNGFTLFYNNITLIMYGIMSLFVSVFSLIVKPIVVTFLDSNYYDSVNYIPILCLSCLFVSLGAMVGAVFSAVRQSKYYFYSSIWSAVSAILLNFFLIKLYGIYGACWSCVLSYIVGSISRVIYARKFTEVYYIVHLIIISLITTSVVVIISYSSNYLASILLTLILLSYMFFVATKLKIVQRFRDKLTN